MAFQFLVGSPATGFEFALKVFKTASALPVQSGLLLVVLRLQLREPRAERGDPFLRSGIDLCCLGVYASSDLGRHPFAYPWSECLVRQHSFKHAVERIKRGGLPAQKLSDTRDDYR